MPLWLTIREAADYLRVSRDYIEARLVFIEDTRPPRAHGKPAGKLRYRRVNTGSDKGGPVRVLAADVYAWLPVPTEVA